MTRIVIKPMDDIMSRFGHKLRELGDEPTAHKVIARAANYEGRKAFTSVKRAIRKQSSIPSAIVQRSTRFVPASTKGGAIETAVVGTGRELSLKLFGPRQFKRGTRAKVWGSMVMHHGAFMGPRPGVIAKGLNGHVFTRTSEGRLPIKKLYGPSVARELLRDQSREAFYAAEPRIILRVEKEIAAVLRGF